MSGSRFHTVVGALLGTTAIVYGIIEMRETARHSAIFVMPSDLGNIFTRRHEVIMVNPGFIGAVTSARHTPVMVDNGEIGEHEVRRHVIVHPSPTTQEWTLTSNTSTIGTFDVALLLTGMTFTDVEYSLDGGTWVSTGVTSGTGSFSMAEAAGAMVQIRTLTALGPSDASSGKLANPLILVSKTSSASTNGSWITPEITADVTKAYLVLATTSRISTSVMTLTADFGPASRGNTVGTLATKIVEGNSANRAQPLAAFIIPVGQAANFNVRIAPVASNTRISVFVYELQSGYTDVDAVNFGGANAGSSITDYVLTPVATPALVLNMLALNVHTPTASFVDFTGHLILNGPYDLQEIFNSAGAQVIRLSKATGPLTISNEYGSSTRAASIALELI